MKQTNLLLAAALGSHLLFACGGEPPPSATSSSAPAPASASASLLDGSDPKTCEPCHAAVVAEWRESLHSRAHHSADPIYGALRALRTEKQGPEIPGKCARCHNPRDVAQHESDAAKLGVSCATCHQLEGVHLEDGKKGVAALDAGPIGRFRGPHDIADGASPAHSTGPALAALTDGKTLCLACHGEEKNAAGLATCSTGTEHVASGETKGCTSCHMDEVQGPSGSVSTRPTHRSHRFRGPHLASREQQPGIVAEAVALSGAFDKDRLVVKLANRSGHAFPTGFPGRMALLEVRAFDAAGKQVYVNVTSEPMKEHPQAVFNMGFADAEGKPALAPFATQLVRDNRLKPGETRELPVEVPKDAKKAELRLKLFLVPPPLAKALSYTGPETAPIVLAPVVVTR